MGSRQIHKLDKTPDHEEIFLRHYAWLVDRSLRLTNGSKEEAEDLVQELYLRFVFSKSDLDITDEDRLRGYLHTVLQNLTNDRHRSSRRDPLTSLQTVDYDSMDSALHAVDRSRLLHVRSDLAGICEYACIRRKTSRAGSVLILRFFLGYYPSEIVGLLKTSPGAVHKLTETARLEARAFLTRPDSLHFLSQAPRTSTSFARRFLPDDPAVLHAELLRRIFSEAEGPCPESGQLVFTYTGNSDAQLTLQEVAHLASCQACLERANHLLQLPVLTTRSSGEFNDDDENSPPSPRITKLEPKARMRKKSRDAYEHRPRNLELAVNGEVRGAQQITSAQSAFRIKLKPSSKPRYIEVFSEQGVCLLYLNLENRAADEPALEGTEVALSDGRLLTLEITHSGCSPVLNVSYFDPALAEGDENWAFEEELRYFTGPDITKQPDLKQQGPLLKLRERLSSWLSAIDLHWPLTVAAAVALTGALAVTGVFISRRPSEQGAALPPPATLLAQSERSADLAIPSRGAAHQTFALEVRGNDGKLIESGTVETFRSVVPQRRSMRFLNSNGKVQAGRWINSNGKLTTYSLREGLRRSSDSESSNVTYADAWSHVPEAADFDRITGDARTLSVRRDKDGYALAYADTTDGNTGSIISAELVLSGDATRPISETLRLREGEKTREYRFREVNYEVLPSPDVNESDFQPGANLGPLHPNISVFPAAHVSAAHLTLEALQLLNNLGPDIERIVNLERHADGSVELNGVFSTSEQRASVVRIFQSLRGNGQLTLALHSSDETAEPFKGPRQTSVESLEPVALDTQRIPFDSALRPVLALQGLTGNQADESIRQIATGVTTHSAQLHREGWSVCQIAANDFTSDELRSLTPEDQMLWVTLLDKHLRAFQQQLAALRTELRPVLHEESARLPASAALPSLLQNTGELEQTAANLNRNSERLARLLTAGFTLSPSSLPAQNNFADIDRLMPDLEREENALHRTIERLQTFGQADLHK